MDPVIENIALKLGINKEQLNLTWLYVQEQGYLSEVNYYQFVYRSVPIHHWIAATFNVSKFEIKDLIQGRSVSSDHVKSFLTTYSKTL